LPCGLFLERLAGKSTAAGRLVYGMAAGLCVVSIFITGSIALVDYIPPELSTSLFGLAIPLFRAGYFVPSVLLFWGLPNPGSGAFIWLLVLAAAALVGHRLGAALPRERKGRGLALLGCVLVFLAIPGLLLTLTRGDAADAGALRFMERTWLAPPGQKVVFWP
jgi:hypothetical protein